MKILFLLFLMSLSQFHALAQLDSIPLVKVTGEYSMKVKPDYVILGISINKIISTGSSEVKLGFRIFEKEDTRIRFFDFNDRDITETLIRFNQKDGKIVYIKDVFLTIRNTEKLDERLFELHKLGYTNYKFIEYRINNLRELKDKSMIEAIKNARVKAVMLAEALGHRIGRAHTIQEIESPNFNWYEIADKSHDSNYGIQLNKTDYLFDPGYIVILSKVKVDFELLK